MIGDQVFGETGSLTDGTVDFDASNNTNDERLMAGSDTASGSFNVKIGYYTFAFSFDTAPGGGA